MKHKIEILAIVSVLALSSVFVGCDRTISKDERTTVGRDGSVKTKEKTVTEKADGTVTKSEETRKTEPVRPGCAGLARSGVPGKTNSASPAPSLLRLTRNLCPS